MMNSKPLVARPIFIVGPGRSGTTLLRSLLSAHSRISITPETQFMNKVTGPDPITGGPDDFETFWSRYTSWVRFKDLGVDPDRCRALIAELGRPSYRNIFHALLAAYRERVGKPRVGEKSPSHVHHLREFLAWFPDAQVLITERDPRAVVASQLKTPYIGQRIVPLSLRQGVFIGKRIGEVVRYARDWAHIHAEVVPQWRRDSRVKVVSYEALVRDPETELRGTCDFLGEPFESAMLTNRSSATVPPAAGVAPNRDLEEWRRQHEATSLRPVSAESLERWKDDLEPRELALIEGICERPMGEAGYERLLPAAVRGSGRLAAGGLRVLGAIEGHTRAAAEAAWHRVHG